jgi:hypothetical protein
MGGLAITSTESNRKLNKPHQHIFHTHTSQTKLTPPTVMAAATAYQITNYSLHLATCKYDYNLTIQGASDDCLGVADDIARRPSWTRITGCLNDLVAILSPSRDAIFL